MTYNPQMREGSPYVKKNYAETMGGSVVARRPSHKDYTHVNEGTRYPLNAWVINSANNTEKKQHSSQKPLLLFKDLVLTFSNEGDNVLDPFCGSGTTAVACKLTGREYYCCDSEQAFVDIANQRVKEQLI